MTNLNLSYFNSFPFLETIRIKLRKLKLNDSSSINSIQNDEKVSQFIQRPLMQLKEEAEKLIDKCHESFMQQKGIALAAKRKKDGKFSGTRGFIHIEYDKLSAKIGGEMKRSFWGTPLAVEVFVSIISFSFEKLVLSSIVARLFPDNKSAILFLESKGSRKESHFSNRLYFNERFYNMGVYSKHNLKLGS